MDAKFLLLTGAVSTLGFGSAWVMTGPAPVATSAAVTSPKAGRAIPRRSGGSSVYYPGCNAVRAAGAAPLYIGEPGYRPEMDGDGDGIACEPHRH